MRLARMMRREDRGAALIVAMVAIIAVAGMAVALINAASTRSKGANSRLDEFQAFQAAQAAVDRAMARIAVAGPEYGSFGVQFLSDSRVGNLTDIATTDGGDDTGGPTGDIDLNALDTTAMIEDVEYFARVGDAGDGTYAIVGAARIGDSERVIEVIVKPPASDDLPGPFPPSGAESGGAITVCGDLTNKAKLKLPGHLTDPHGEDNIVSISGIDKSAQGADTLGLGISDADNFDSLIGDILKKMAQGKIPEGIFDGNPLNTFDVDAKGKGKDKDVSGTVTTSIGETAGGIDGNQIIDYADAVADTVRDMVVEAQAGTNPDYTYIDDDTFKATKGEVLTDYTFGTSADSVTIIDTTKIKFDKKHSGEDAVISGQGTLVILGELDVHHADFEWDGDIIVLGDERDAKIHNHHGTLDVEGTIVVLGSGAKGKSGIHIHNDKKEDDSTSSINGGVLLMSGADDTKEKVEFKVHHGSLDMRGILMMLGHQIKVDLHPEHGKKKGDPGHFSFDGNMILGVEAAGDIYDKKGKLKKSKASKLDIKIKGNVAIQHDSDAVDDALALFKDFFDEYAPDVERPPAVGNYDVILWREK